MRRVLIIGNSGGGKSSLARALGERTGLPVIHLDVLFFKPNWVESDRLQFRQRVAEALAAPQWICDGNFGSTYDLRMPLADTIIWIDRPRLQCLYRAIRRAITYSRGGRPDMAPGCRETIDLKFYRFIWTFDAAIRPRLEAALAEHGSHARLERLRCDDEVARFLASVPAEARP